MSHWFVFFLEETLGKGTITSYIFRRFRHEGADGSGGVTGDDSVWGNVAGDDAAGTDDAVVADADTGKDLHTCIDPDVVAHGDGESPLLAGVTPPASRGCCAVWKPHPGPTKT